MGGASCGARANARRCRSTRPRGCPRITPERYGGAVDRCPHSIEDTDEEEDEDDA